MDYSNDQNGAGAFFYTGAEDLSFGYFAQNGGYQGNDFGFELTNGGIPAEMMQDGPSLDFHIESPPSSYDAAFAPNSLATEPTDVTFTLEPTPFDTLSRDTSERETPEDDFDPNDAASDTSYEPSPEPEMKLKKGGKSKKTSGKGAVPRGKSRSSTGKGRSFGETSSNTVKKTRNRAMRGCVESGLKLNWGWSHIVEVYNQNKYRKEIERGQQVDLQKPIPGYDEAFAKKQRQKESNRLAQGRRQVKLVRRAREGSLGAAKLLKWSDKKISEIPALAQASNGETTGASSGPTVSLPVREKQVKSKGQKKPAKTAASNQSSFVSGNGSEAADERNTMGPVSLDDYKRAQQAADRAMAIAQQACQEAHAAQQYASQVKAELESSQTTLKHASKTKKSQIKVEDGGEMMMGGLWESRPSNFPAEYDDKLWWGKGFVNPW